MVDGKPLQRSLFPRLGNGWRMPLTETEQYVASILKIVRVEKDVPFSCTNPWMGKKAQRKGINSALFCSQGGIRVSLYPVTH